MEENTIPPKSEWHTLSINQLYDIKLKMSDKYYAMRGINASFTDQYLQFISEIDARISVLENAPPEEEN
jgi:hypothetical protein